MAYIKLKNASLKVIQRAGYMSPVEEPDIVNEHINKFLGDLQD